MEKFIETVYAHGTAHLIVGTIAAVTGYGFQKIRQAKDSYFNYHKIWSVFKRNSAAIVLGTKTSDDTNIKIQTHINEMKAYRAIYEILHKKTKSIFTYASEQDWPHEEYRSQILVGGPLRNSHASDILELHNVFFKYIDENDKVNGVKMSINSKNFEPTYEPKKPNGRVRKVMYDYGVAIRSNFNNQNILVLSGCHAYATFAAARVVTEKYYLKKINKNYKNYLVDNIGDSTLNPILIPIGCRVFYGENSLVGTIRQIDLI